MPTGVLLTRRGPRNRSRVRLVSYLRRRLLHKSLARTEWPNQEAQVNLPTVNGTQANVAPWSELRDRSPAYALVSNVDLVVIRFDDHVAVLYGRCHHRGALLAGGHIDGPNLICGVHGWDYRYDTGVSSTTTTKHYTAFPPSSTKRRIRCGWTRRKSRRSPSRIRSPTGETSISASIKTYTAARRNHSTTTFRSSRGHTATLIFRTSLCATSRHGSEISRT